MKAIKSYLFTPNEIQLAHELAQALDDEKSLNFYLHCAKKYPHEYLLVTLAHVSSLPSHSIKTTRARLFTSIITKSIYNTNDYTWD
ncbi:hypothetical protein [Leadbetterella sp. DM7]|uniref:hypothetical protein n=1 Tax=Leadbetterella sp. DM7 TaxID=3235085 RepID=UPI00349EF711